MCNCSVVQESMCRFVTLTFYKGSLKVIKNVLALTLVERFLNVICHLETF